MLDKSWLEEIARPFEKKNEVEVVGGFYLPTGETILQKTLAQLTSISLEKVHPETFLPSSRSIAFRKSAWQKVGGYPENLNYCEDLIFDLRLKRTGCLFDFAPKAIVYWSQKDTLRSALKQFFNYAIGDGMAEREGPHFWKLLGQLGLLSGLIGLGMLKQFGFLGIIMVGIFGYKALKLAIKIRNPLVFPVAFLLLPLLNLAVLVGFISGIIKKHLNGSN